ncbi:DNA-binding transcriptional MocR family regulator [Variovorax boronicumulans]|uniref:aminotransferase-like domain-containing protein n=1 Tax=Variovorax boronicumulans TaxID=436515 RepID=UPI00277D720A|nr:aminotransferase class I/II-fold pyridoxal phosphate-dependent enzyme [Variovorax boronicumulans]MDQ0038616.1 DNA-binding transcriptional MocR family regulator [Variovorax boronicumulans]
MNRYEKLADNIAQRIRTGSLKANDRLPSVRELKSQLGISASTVFSAYYLLEAQGLVEARQRSGYFVRAGVEMQASELAASEPVLQSMSVDVSSLVFQVLAQARERDMVPLGSAFPSPELFPFEQLAAGMTRALKRMDPWQTVEDLSPGNAQLRHQISLRYGSVGMDVPASELVITSGAMEALNLALESVTQPGDVVAIETPTFYGALQALERRGLRAVEVETHPRTGVDLNSLARVIDEHPVKACWFMPTFQNPMGCTMSDAAKERLVGMLATRAIPLIEDDVYGELAHGARRPPPAKAWDRAGWVLHCSSFSKSLAPGYRIGWVAGGRFAATLGRNKLMSSLATALPSQLALQEYLQHKSFDRHLRALRHSLSRQQAACLRLIDRYFPTGTRVTRPEGGYFLWLALPEGVDSLALHQDALRFGIGVAPGHLFSADRRYIRHLRINYGYLGDPRLEGAIRSLGDLAKAQLKSTTGRSGPHFEERSSRP